MGTRYLAADCRKRPAESKGEDSTKKMAVVDKESMFLKQLQYDFGEQCASDIAKKEPRICLYSGIGTSGGQTLTCSNIALQYYMDAKRKLYSLDMGRPMDSNGFELILKKHDSYLSIWYVHVNFWALSSTGVRKLFFAELKGTDDPNETVAVVPLGHDSETIRAESGEHLCRFCSGILHPRFGTFQGCKCEPA